MTTPLSQLEVENCNRHINSLLRIGKACGLKREEIVGLSIFEVEDRILQILEQRRLEQKRERKTMETLKEEIDMLRQTSIFDFLKIHHDEIKAQNTRYQMDDDG